MVLARGLLDCVNSELRNNDMINRFIERHRSGNVSGITSQKSDPHVKYVILTFKCAPAKLTLTPLKTLHNSKKHRKDTSLNWWTDLVVALIHTKQE